MANISKIEKSDLYKLEPLLRASFGEGFDIQDELDYFSQMPHSSWFYLYDHQPTGFIRCFNVHNELYTVELYVGKALQRSELLEALIKHFLAYNQLASEASIRFAVGESDTALLDILARLFPNSRVERFLYLRRLLPDYDGEIREYELSGEDLERVRDILKILKTYSVAELASLYLNKRVCVHCEDNIPVAALQLGPSAQGTCEIITLATDSSQLRKGYATKLLRKAFQEVAAHSGEMGLKVNEKNTAALNLYERLGFQVFPEKHEQWWNVSANLMK